MSCDMYIEPAQATILIDKCEPAKYEIKDQLWCRQTDTNRMVCTATKPIEKKKVEANYMGTLLLGSLLAIIYIYSVVSAFRLGVRAGEHKALDFVLETLEKFVVVEKKPKTAKAVKK